jgi:hypothetical protein
MQSTGAVDRINWRPNGSISIQSTRIDASAGAGYIALRRPAAMGIPGNGLYLFDSGLHKIFRYDRGQ